ncbi:MAG: hypothetical protein QOI15_1928 [Pseudonocardiales bacterium]|jgi:hypothetical protein|nr:hypothetical protein [Pseudonocardiales bacterium]MDT4921026.1 hypothetical protein [Pseudonocardiales bacterium]
MRRIWTMTSAAVVALGLALAVPAAASASGLASTAGTCDVSAYPPAPHATIMASTTTPFVGETIEASGTVYCPDEDVRITLAGAFVTTTHTDQAGDFDPPVKVTQVGKLRLCGIGASGLPNDRDCLMLTVRAHDQGGGGHNPGGGTSFTGVDVLLLVLLAVVLLAAGWALVAAGRRKRLIESRS